MANINIKNKISNKKIFINSANDKNVEVLGQVFTSSDIVQEMYLLRKNKGNILEPSCGEGAFCFGVENLTAIEYDPNVAPKFALNIDFFDYSIENKFDTIIGNPPYVRYQDISHDTKKKLDMSLFDKRSNLYLFFIEKCIKHLKNGGELIFITPRDFLKNTSSIKLNSFIYDNGTITDIRETGDSLIFEGALPNCIIWRFEKNNFNRKTNFNKTFSFVAGQLMFLEQDYPVNFRDIFDVKVGAVSGADKIFTNVNGNMDFVNSTTRKTGDLRKMLFNVEHEELLPHKETLLKRKIRVFTEKTWYRWGRMHHKSSGSRIYVNIKTRLKNPFFTNKCLNYDGSILAIFPKNKNISTKELNKLISMLNKVDWNELGFVCNGRFIFTQKALLNCKLPSSFSFLC